MITSKSDYHFIDFEHDTQCPLDVKGEIVPYFDINAKDPQLKAEDVFHLNEMKMERNYILCARSGNGYMKWTDAVWVRNGNAVIYGWRVSTICDEYNDWADIGNASSLSQNVSYLLAANPGYSLTLTELSEAAIQANTFITVANIKEAFPSLPKSIQSITKPEMSELDAGFIRLLYRRLDDIKTFVVGTNSSGQVSYASETNTSWKVVEYGKADRDQYTYSHTNDLLTYVGGQFPAPQYSGDGRKQGNCAYLEQEFTPVDDGSSCRVGISRTAGMATFSLRTKCTRATAILKFDAFCGVGIMSSENPYTRKHILLPVDGTLSANGTVATLNLGDALDAVVAHAKSWHLSDNKVTNVSLMDVNVVCTIDPISRLDGWNWQPS